MKHIFEINEETNTISVTPEFETDIKNAKNPQILLMIGNSRCGKSTLLNAILYFCTEKQNIQERMNIDEPFKTSDEVEGCTKDFD